MGFEPNPKHQKRLKELEKRYSQKNWNVHFFPLAVSNGNGNVTFYITDNCPVSFLSILVSFLWEMTVYIRCNNDYVLITARKQSLRRLCFHRCLSVCPQVGCLPHCMLGYTHPPGLKAPSGKTPPSGRHPQEDTPQQTPPSRHLPDRHPPRVTCWDTVNKRAVHIPLECILV